MMSNEDIHSWRTPGFRQSMVAKIEDAIMKFGTSTSKNAAEMEAQVFTKAKSKDEYLGLMARLIMHINEMGAKKMGVMTQSSQQNQGNPMTMTQSGAGGGQMGMMSQMNQMNVLNQQHQQHVQLPNGMIQQGLNQNQLLQQQQQQQQQQQNLQTQQQLPFLQQQQIQNVQQQQNSVQNPNQMQQMQLQQNTQQQALQQQGIGHSQLGNMNVNLVQQQQQQIHASQHSQMPPQMQPPVSMQSMPQQLSQNQLQHSQQLQQQQQQQQQQVQIQNQQQLHQRPPHVTNTMTGMMAPGQLPHGVRPISSTGVMPNRMMGPTGSAVMSSQLSQMAQQRKAQARMAGSVSDTVGISVGQGTGTQQLQRPITPSNNQFIPPNSSQSLSSIASPSSSNIPTGSTTNFTSTIGSGSMLGNSPGPAHTLRYPSQLGVPSPGTSINTPLMAVATPSPRNSEDQACFEKIKELRKYIDLLQRMIAKIGNDDVEKSSKMKKLLEILTNPNHKVSMDILLKCEVALKKMERQQHDAPISLPGHILREQTTSPFQQFVDAVINTMKSSTASHTLLRTFKPSVEAIRGFSFGNGIDMLDDTDISLDTDYVLQTETQSILQRELSFLESRYKFVIDKKRNYNKNIPMRVNFSLRDSKLPLVPPLKIVIPQNYPDDTPKVLIAKDYGSSPFLKSIGKAMKSRILYLNDKYTITELLNIWEMSVRQAANPNALRERKLYKLRLPVQLSL